MNPAKSRNNPGGSLRAATINNNQLATTTSTVTTNPISQPGTGDLALETDPPPSHATRTQPRAALANVARQSPQPPPQCLSSFTGREPLPRSAVAAGGVTTHS